jgi:hypothetical protein
MLRFEAFGLCVAMGVALKNPNSIYRETVGKPTSIITPPIGKKTHGPNAPMSSDDEQMADKVAFEAAQDGWHLFPSASKHTVYGFIHIPKVAGTSFITLSKGAFPDGDGFFSEEICPTEILHELNRETQERHLSDMSFELVTFLRSPRAHVYSQYLELKYDTEWNWPGKEQFIRGFPTVTQFLDRFTSGSGTNHTDYPAYHPQDMQTRSLVCKTDNHGYHALGAGDLENALGIVNSLKFIGISESFQASVCVFLDKVMPSRLLPDYCDCQNTAGWASFAFPHVTHGVPKHSINDLSAEDLLKIDKLTPMDVKVYDAALERFHSDVRELEERRGLRIHCK